MLVTQIMTPDVITVAPETPINEVARLMGERGVSGVPVVDPASGELVGLITELDMIERQAEFDAPIYSTFFDALFVIGEDDTEERLARILATRAEQLMERTVYAIREDATVQDAATLMFERKVNPVPVVSLDGELLGIVSRSDIVRLMARDFTEPGADADTATTIDDPTDAQDPVRAVPAGTAPIEPLALGNPRETVIRSDDFIDRPSSDDVPDLPRRDSR